MGLNPRPAKAWRALRNALPALVIVGAAALLWLGGTELRDALSFDRPAIRSGEAWRLLSGHLVHLGTSHVLLNVAGVALVWLLVGKEFTVLEWALISVFVVVAIDAGLWWLNPELEWYVGLSGALHGWLAAGVVAGMVKRRQDAWLLAALIAAKLVFEQWQGPVPGSAESAGGPVIVDAHLYGAIAGAVAGFVLTRLNKRTGL